jgi:hypothetical protein
MGCFDGPTWLRVLVDTNRMADFNTIDITVVDMEKAESVRSSEYVKPFKASKEELFGALLVGFQIPRPQSLE